MDYMHKGMDEWGGCGWAARGGLYVAMSPRTKLLVIGLNKPEGPKRRLIKTGVNIRPIPPM